MAYILYTLCTCIVLQYLLRVLKSAFARQRALKIGASSICEPILKLRSWDPLFRLDQFIRLRKASVQGRLSQAHSELHSKYGPTFEMTVLGLPRIQTAHPENIQTVCTSSFEDWGVGPMRGGIGKPFIERGIFTDDGAFWRHSRSLIRPTFNRTEIADLTNFERHTQRLLKLIPPDGLPFDLLPLIKRLFLDTSTEFIFGKSVDSLLPETPFETDEFMKAFDRSLLGLALLLVFGPFRWPLYLDPWWRAASTKVHKFVDKQVADILQRRKLQASQVEKTAVQADSEKPAATVYAGHKTRERYILLTGMAEVTQDPYDLRMQIINAFFPARDTAAIAFSDVIFSLARHPTAWQDLRKEVLALGPGTSQLTYEVVRSLKMVRAVINESLRLHPAASRIGRTSLRDTILPKGGGPTGDAPIFVPAGTALEMDLYTLQRDPTIWGDDADVFRPERWGPGRPLWEARWQYEPFLGGVRMCPAQNMVITQLSYLLVRFVQEFRTLENHDPVLEYVEEVTMTVASRNGVKIALTRDGNI